MALKKLSQFESVDTDALFNGFKLGLVGKSEWKEFETGKHLGTKCEVVIIADNHKYKVTDGEVVSNLYEKLAVKVPKEIDIPMNSQIRLVNPKATIYGQYRNQISVIADDIEAVSK